MSVLHPQYHGQRGCAWRIGRFAMQSMVSDTSLTLGVVLANKWAVRFKLLCICHFQDKFNRL